MTETKTPYDDLDEQIKAETRRQVRAVVKFAAVAVAVVGLAFGLAACGAKYQEPYKDAPTTGKHIRTPWTVIEAPDGFSNQATSCLVLPDGTKPGVRLFSAYHGDHAYGSVNQIVDDSCK
jgi:hypothetical protein